MLDMLQNDRCFSECKPLLNFEEINILQNLEIDIQQMSAAAYQMGSYEKSYILMRATYDLHYELQVGGLAGTVFPARGLITEVYIYAKDWL